VGYYDDEIHVSLSILRHLFVGRFDSELSRLAREDALRIQHLVTVAALPESSSRRGGSVRVTRVGNLAVVHGRLSVSPGAAALEQDDEGREEEQDHGGEDGPHAYREVGVAACTIIVDVVLDDAEGDKVGDHDDEGDDPGQSGDNGSEQRAEDARAEGEEEGDECKTAGDGMQDHDAGESVRGVAADGAEASSINLAHDGSGLIAD